MYCGGQDAASALKNGKLVRSLQFYVLAKLPQMTKLVPVRYAQTDSLRFPFLKKPRQPQSPQNGGDSAARVPWRNAWNVAQTATIGSRLTGAVDRLVLTIKKQRLGKTA